MININIKILWYFSHFTYSNNIFLLSYFTLKTFDINVNNFYITIAPVTLSINLNYFLIYSKKY